MLSKLENNTNVNTNKSTVVAYRYQVTLAEDLISAVHGGYDITEFYIPSINIRFNKQAISQSHVARNSVGLFSHATMSPITEVHLSAELVEKILSVYNSLHKVDDNGNVLASTSALMFDPVFADLFMAVSVREGNDTRHLDVRFLDGDERDFELAYRSFGNDALIPYMLKYIQNGVPRQREIFDRLLDITKHLTPVEKNSLKASLEDNINLIKENHKDDSADMITPSAAGLATGWVAMDATKNPLVGLGVGVLTGVATFFGKNAVTNVYHQYQDNQRENVKQQFFALLDDGNVHALDNKVGKPRL